MNDNQMAILEHALGMKNGLLPAEITRRFYIAGKHTNEHRDCLALMDMEYMREVHSSCMDDDLQMFHVTDECIELLCDSEKLRKNHILRVFGFDQTLLETTEVQARDE